MVLKGNEDFLNELQLMYSKCIEQNSVWLTFKRYDGVDRPKPKPKKVNKKNKKAKKVEVKPRPKPFDEPKMLVRAKTSKQKISTVVERTDLNSFHQKLNKVIKSSHDGLKKPRKNRGGKKGGNAAEKEQKASGDQ